MRGSGVMRSSRKGFRKKTKAGKSFFKNLEE